MKVKNITISRPNFLGSEVGLVSKTITVPASQSTGVVDENDRKVVVAGTYFTAPYKGLLLADIDITDGDAIAPLMVAGYYIDEKLPTSVAGSASDLQKQGLFAIKEGDVTRPDFGDEDLVVQLATPTISASGAVVTITSVTGAVGYDIYESASQSGDYAKIASVTGTTYTADKSCYVKVKAKGDNLFYSDSDLSTAAQVTKG